VAASLLKQVAEEVGNVYTNRREHTGKAGGAIKREYRDVEEMTDEELRAEPRQILSDPNRLQLLLGDGEELAALAALAEAGAADLAESH
jgi:hypothetical protein